MTEFFDKNMKLTDPAALSDKELQDELIWWGRMILRVPDWQIGDCTPAPNAPLDYLRKLPQRYRCMGAMYWATREEARTRGLI
jgi:hypothetical protein